MEGSPKGPGTASFFSRQVVLWLTALLCKYLTVVKDPCQDLLVGHPRCLPLAALEQIEVQVLDTYPICQTC